TEEALFSIINDSFENMDVSLNPSEKYKKVMSLLNFPISPELHRKASKFILEHILADEPNVIHLNTDGTSLINRFILSYFNNFENDNPQGVERNIRYFIKLAEQNIFEHRNKKYFKRYEDSRVFEGEKRNIENLSFSLKKIPPVDNKAFDFFRYKSQENSLQTEKRFYKLILSLQYRTAGKQITLNGIKTRVISI